MSGTGTATQDRNSDLVALLTPEFQGRYEPQFSTSRACAIYQFLPGLRAFYPMSAVGTSGEARDLGGSGTSYDLTNNNTARFRYSELYPWVDFDGANQYLSFVDNANFDIVGTEGYFAPAVRGLAIYAWVRFDNAAAANEYVVAKWRSGTSDKSYRILRNAAGLPLASISVDGSTDYDALGATTLVEDTWYCVGLQYSPSTKLSVWVNGKEDGSNAVATPASIYDGASPFTLGANGTPASYLNGRESQVAICAQFNSDSFYRYVFNQTKAMFGVS